MNALLLAAALFAAPPGTSGTPAPAGDSHATPADVSAARRHFLEARDLESQGRAADALTEYRAAFRLDGKSRDLCFLLLGRLKEANAVDSAAALSARCLSLAGEPLAVEYKLAGEIALRADEAADALKYYNEARRLDPEDGDVLYVLAGLSEEIGDWAGYASAVRDLMPRLDYPPVLMDRLMRAYGRLDSTDALEPVLREAWEKTGRIPYGQALAAWYDLRDLPLSFLNTARSLAEKDPASEYRWLLARAYLRADRSDSALALCRALRQEKPGDADLRYFEASILFDRGRYKEAHALAEALARDFPQQPSFVFLAGASALELRKRAAVATLEKALALSPLAPEYRARIAYADRVFGKRAREGLLAYAVTDSLDAEEALFLEGAAHASLAALLEPREPWRRAAVLTDSAAARVARRAALDRFTRVLAADTSNRAALFEVSVQAERLGDREATKGFLRRLVRRDSTNAMALNYLGYVLVEYPGASPAELAEAGALLERAVRLEPENGAYLDSKGWWHYRSGELDSARVWLERSFEAMPSDVSVLDHLAEVLRAQGPAGAEEGCLVAKHIRALDPRRPLPRECAAAVPVKVAP